MIWPRDNIYMISHLVIGIIGYFSPALLIAFIAYQFIQYIFDFRFFLFEMTIKKHNSLEHTAYKLMEAFLGYIMTMIYVKYGIVQGHNGDNGPGVNEPGVNIPPNFVTSTSIDG